MYNPSSKFGGFPSCLTDINSPNLDGMSKEKYIDQIVANEANVTSEYADAWRKAQGGGTRPSNSYNGPGPGGGGNNPRFDPGP